MIESPDTRYEPLNLPVCSLYSRTRRPAMQQLRDLDLLLIDLQDVGTRVYTFVWTMLECLRACAEAGIPVCVLDRPNPLGGLIVEGPPIASGFESFVGNASVPMRHGLTMAELAVLLNRELQVGADALHSHGGLAAFSSVARSRAGMGSAISEHAPLGNLLCVSRTGPAGRTQSVRRSRHNPAL